MASEYIMQLVFSLINNICDKLSGAGEFLCEAYDCMHGYKAPTSKEIGTFFKADFVLPAFLWREFWRAVSKRCSIGEQIHWFHMDGRLIFVT